MDLKSQAERSRAWEPVICEHAFTKAIEARFASLLAPENFGALILIRWRSDHVNAGIL